MRWLVLDLWPVLCWGLLWTCILGLAIGYPLVVFWDMSHHPVFSSSHGLDGSLLVIIASFSALVPLFFVGGQNHWPFAILCRTRHFQTVVSDRIVLRYAPELHGKIDTEEVLALAEKALNELETMFGPLAQFWHRTAGPGLFRKRLFVYLFSTSKAVQRIFGANNSGAALAAYQAIVISFEYPRLDELFKHEISHLFSHRWNDRPSPLLQEGLSTWLQGTERGYTIDSIAFTLIWHEEYRLRRMLSRKFFFAKVNCWACYMLAGSFTGFLIRKFGWKAYKRLYSRAEGKWRFDAKFVKRFGLTLEEAEEQWRTELRERYKEMGPAWLMGVQASQDTYRPRDN